MAGNYDRFWGRSKGTRSQFRLEGLQPFKCTYPVHLTDIMDIGQSSQTNSQRTQFATSPFTETQTKAVREYEETINQLKKENFDLKVRLFLCEQAHKETYHVKSSNNDEKRDCIEIIVDLKLEVDNLNKELNGKDEEVQSIADKYSAEIEKYQTELSEAEKKIKEQKEFIEILEQLPTADDYNEVRRELSGMVKNIEDLEQRLIEKDNEIEKANEELKESQDKIAVLNKKISQRDKAIISCATKYNNDLHHIPKPMRPIIKATIEAAVNNNETELLSCLEDFKRSLSEIMGVPIPTNHQTTHVGDFNSQNISATNSSSSSENSRIRETSSICDSTTASVAQPYSIVEGDLDSTEIAVSNVLVSDSRESIQSGLEAGTTESNPSSKSSSSNEMNAETMTQTSDENIRVENLTATFSKLEEREQELNNKLGEAYTKINFLEEELKKKQSLISKDLAQSDSFSQTDIAWHSLQSRISDKNLQEFGTSNSISELKEEILMLILAIEQKDKELSDFNQNSLVSPVDEDYSTERDELQQRLATSCSINKELLKHLQSLESFMEELLQQKNFSSSSMENINESTDFFSQLSSCLDQSLKLSRTLSDQLSICEGSRIFDSNDFTMQEGGFNASVRNSTGRLQDSRFSQEDSDIPYIYQEGRRNFYSSFKENQNFLGTRNLSDIYSSQKLQSFIGKRQTADSLSTNPDNVVVLKTSNNEDLILLLNEQGDPKDVLIRNNGVHNQNSDQHRRRCWDTPTTNNDFWSREKLAAQYKENVYNVETTNVFKSNYMRYNTWMSSDSDTWSEPDRNVSMQRIGIDVQTSPVTSRSPRKSRFKDRRIAEDSTKNESASSYMKLHSFSKRRRSSEISKMSFICKKCQKLSQQHDDTLQEEMENLSKLLKNKEEIIKSLDEKQKSLTRDIIDLRKELTEYQRNNDILISKVREKESSNNELKEIIDSLEINVKNSDAECEKLKTELNRTKERLMILDKKCAKYENTNSSDEAECQKKLLVLEQKEKKLLEDINDINLQKNSLSDELNEERKRAETMSRENMGMAKTISDTNEAISQLKNSNKELKENLESSNSVKESLKSEIKNLKAEVQGLKSNCESLEAKVNFLTKSKQNIIDLLLQFEISFSSNLKTLSNACNLKFDLDTNVEDMPYLEDEDERVTTLLKDIIMENSKLEELASDFCEHFKNIQNIKQNAEKEKHKSSMLEHQIMLKDEEIKTLNGEIDKLQGLKDDLYELQSYVELYRADFELLENQKSLLEEKEDRIKILEERNINFENNEKILLDEVISFKKALESSGIEIRSLQECLETLEKSSEDDKNLLDLKQKENDKLQEQISAIKVATSKSDQELLQKQISQLEEKDNYIIAAEKKNNKLKDHVKTLQSEKNSFEKALSSANVELSSLHERSVALAKSNEDLRNLLDVKQKDIDKLQERIFSLQSQTNELLEEKMNLSGRQSKSSETREKAASPDSSTIIEVSSDSLLQSVSKVMVDSDNSCPSVKSIKSDLISSSSTVKKDREKYLKYIKSLQKKLEEADTRIEVLEQEKNSLRENLLCSVRNGKKNSPVKVEEKSSKDIKLAELESLLDTKQSFINELKSDLYKAHNSIIDKQNEMDKLQQELCKLKMLNEKNTRTMHQSIPNNRWSDSFSLSTEANVSELRKRKIELLNSLLGLQRQFYEARNIHLNHFETFTKHIESLRALQINPYLLKSESAPLLNNSETSSVGQDKQWNRTLKNAQIDMEVDIECLQNFNIFLKRFFSPIMNQSNDVVAQKDVDFQERSISIRSVETSKLNTKNFSSTAEQSQIEKEGPSHDRLATTASTISAKLDWMESIMKNIIEDVEHFSDIQTVINETARETAAKSILLKLFDGLDSLAENANEIFYMNSRLKSLELFDNNSHDHNTKQDISDNESLLSDETIALRSASLSPVSFDGQFPHSVHQKLKGRTLIHSYLKQSEEIKRIPLRPSHKVICSSQDSVCQRSHYSSPDLGIESDPNHEHSAPEQTDKFHSTKVSTSQQDLSASAMYRNLDRQRLSSIYNYSDSSFRSKDKSLPLVLGGALHAIGVLQDYELLKKEIAESIVGIKSVLSRTGDGMQHITCNTSPRKLQNLEYSTFKAIKDTCFNIDVCLQKANKLVNSFRVATYPSEEELRQLLQHNEELNSKLKKLTDLKRKQEKDFKDVLDQLKQAEKMKEQQERKISKQLVKHKKVIRLAEQKILETRHKELPLISKRSSKPSINPL